jgi:uncharacterized protein YcaQ
VAFAKLSAKHFEYFFSMARLEVSNEAARRLFLDRHLLTERTQHPMTDDDVLALVRRLGFVQLDSINVVERAHHMILFSRAAGYARGLLSSLHHDRRALFEHWTHDASLLPIEFYPHWHHRFRDARARLARPGWQSRIGPEPSKTIARVRRRIRRRGPVSARDFEDKGEGSWWGWGPSKTALEYLWRTGELAVAWRDGFQKVYDFSERIIPEEFRTTRPTRRQTIEWACRESLSRLGFATPSELAGFFDLIDIAEARAWAKSALRKKSIVEIGISGYDGTMRPALAPPSIEADIAALTAPPAAARFLSPFDPAIRDRKRSLRLFGFDYTIEVFVPEKKRRYGYYVMPILEGDRLIGRADLKAHRAESRVEMKGLWLERGVARDRPRERAIDFALAELSRFVGKRG